MTRNFEIQQNEQEKEQY